MICPGLAGGMTFSQTLAWGPLTGWVLFWLYVSEHRKNSTASGLEKHDSGGGNYIRRERTHKGRSKMQFIILVPGPTLNWVPLLMALDKESLTQMGIYC